ncbi:hypothetical protein FJV76_32290 [Mesorhizobium sp. WSM4303]|uniref:hypothetical protein n=1 Tax=unclassified Mesorhizobium TaxID=325217 RepID=UPI00115E0366|nr:MULTISPECIES: hypothetical protein [unclassified Mesorhizobium]TRC92181.1 hypothetical protein FJV77_25880 [Mesorhizobium sp. WSM4306]TRC92812.1 hypothetical protein FJV76_32290 [Mesorhizobium sp. WSM4303]
MGKGVKVGDEVAITATVRRRVTEDRISVSIPSYGFPHSIVDSATKVKRGQAIELTGDVLRVDEEKVTIDLHPPVTVDLDKVRLVTSYVAPKRKRPLVDKPA